ncbi:hypothetical protein [Burkholderia ubonensis]|nr:hypothetical protein [Burkholderia ubonensis]
MAAGHIRTHIGLGRKDQADFKRKHRKWPLGTAVMVQTPAGYLRGRIFKHWRINENPHGATVEFPEVVDMGDANGTRYCHVIPFRNMRPVKADAVGEKLFKRLKSLTELNLHGECYATAARALGLPNLVEQFERIERARAQAGYLSPQLYSERYRAYEKLLAEAKRQLSDLQYAQLYLCF